LVESEVVEKWPLGILARRECYCQSEDRIHAYLRRAAAAATDDIHEDFCRDSSGTTPGQPHRSTKIA